MKGEVKKKSSSFFPVYFVFFLDNFGFSLVFTIFAPLLLDNAYGFLPESDVVGTRNLMLGWLFAVFPLAQLFGAPLIGDLADRFGRKRSFYITLVGSVIGYLCSAVAIFVHSFSFLIISRIITGFFSGNLSLCLASIADMSPTEKVRGRHYGFIATTAGVSWIIAMLVGGYTSDVKIFHLFNPAVPFLITAVLTLFALWAIAAAFHETRPTRQKRVKVDLMRGVKNIAQSFKLKEVRWLYLVYLLWSIGWGSTLQWFTPFVMERFHISIIEASWILVVFGCSWSLGGSLFNWVFLKRLTSAAVAKWSLGLTTLLIFGTAICYFFHPFSWMYIVSAAFAGVAMSNILNIISLSAPANVQGRVMGLSQSTMSLGWIIGPIVTGFLADWTITSIYYFAAFVLLLSFISLMCEQFHRKKKKKLSNPFLEMQK